MTAGARERDAAEQWAGSILGVRNRPSGQPLRTALFDSVRRHGFQLCDSSAEAVEMLSGRGPTRDPLADETPFQRNYESQLLDDIDQLGTEFYALSSEDRRERWTMYRDASEHVPTARGLLARLQPGIDLPAVAPGNSPPETALRILAQRLRMTKPHRRSEAQARVLHFLSDARVSEMLEIAAGSTDVGMLQLRLRLQRELRIRREQSHSRIAQWEIERETVERARSERQAARFKDECVEPDVVTVFDVVHVDQLFRFVFWIMFLSILAVGLAAVIKSCVHF